jgi:hypothetical protein
MKGKVIPMKKRLFSFLLVGLLLATTCVPAYAAEELTPQSSEATPQLFAPTSIDTSLKNVSLNGGTSRSWNFDMKTGFMGWGDPHNAFTVEISNVSANAKYTLSISYDGIEIWNQQYTGVGTTVFTQYCSPNQYFKVMIVNDRVTSMTFDISIISYIN